MMSARSIAIACLTIANCLLLGLSPAPASDSATSDFDGYWGGSFGFKRPSWVAEAQLRISDGYGELEFQTRGAPAFYTAVREGRLTLPEPFRVVPADVSNPRPDARCTYYLKVAPDGTAKAIVKTGMVTSLCPSDPQIDFRRQEGEGGTQLVFHLASDTLEVEYALYGGYRPLRAGEMTVIPDSLDVLGVRPGHTFDEARSILTDAGYVLLPPDEGGKSTRIADDWSQEAFAFAKGEPWPSGKDRTYPDAILLVLETQEAGKGASPVAPAGRQVLYVHRKVAYPKGEGVDVAAMRGALQKKYGPSAGMTSSEMRVYDTAGNVVAPPNATRFLARCAKSNLQEINYQIPDSPEITIHKKLIEDVHPDCGSTVDIEFWNPKNNMTDRMEVGVMNHAMIYRDAWKRSRNVVRADALAQFERMASEGAGDTPDL
ncbi:hypothetical protein FHS78_002973 [Parvibaculum indicum]|uniref:hypothetical protein n=1 Tax=Parvibaculum indicum TaxID=562969 RepID=UPI0014247BB3|nr:hypothetical protein [Parvibaculum indicum]NIJ42668.1 hypothetical protein [Parvibaculum indicum]